MKKPILILLFAILFTNLVYAQVDDIYDKVDEKFDKFGNVIDNPEDAGQIAQDYLKQEWGKILEKNKFFGPIIAQYKKISPYTDPVFGIVLGIAPGLNWLFVLTLALWITFLIFIYRAFHLYGFFSEGVGLIISLCILVIISVLGIPKQFANWIINAISLLGNPIIQLIIAVLVLIGLIFLVKFSKEIEKYMKGVKERRKKMKEALRKAETEIHAKKIETISKAIDKGLSNN